MQPYWGAGDCVLLLCLDGINRLQLILIVKNTTDCLVLQNEMMFVCFDTSSRHMNTLCGKVQRILSCSRWYVYIQLPPSLQLTQRSRECSNIIMSVTTCNNPQNSAASEHSNHHVFRKTLHLSSFGAILTLWRRNFLLNFSTPCI